MKFVAIKTVEQLDLQGLPTINELVPLREQQTSEDRGGCNSAADPAPRFEAALGATGK